MVVSKFADVLWNCDVASDSVDIVGLVRELLRFELSVPVESTGGTVVVDNIEPIDDSSLFVIIVGIGDVSYIIFDVVMELFSGESELIVSIVEFFNVEESIVDCCLVVSSTVIDSVTAFVDKSIFVCDFA